MSEQMRIDFEAWAISEAAKMQYSFPEEAVQINGLGDYAIVWVQGAWLGWQASRAALCVELPAKWNAVIDGRGRGMYAEDEARDSTIDDCRDAIHAAGVKTK